MYEREREKERELDKGEGSKKVMLKCLIRRNRQQKIIFNPTLSNIYSGTWWAMYQLCRMVYKLVSMILSQCYCPSKTIKWINEHINENKCDKSNIRNKREKTPQVLILSQS